MTVSLQLLSVETGVRDESSPYRPNEAFCTSIFIDAESENRMAAFLQWDDDAGKKLKLGQTYMFSITGLGPVKNDRSRCYLRGGIVDGK